MNKLIILLIIAVIALSGCAEKNVTNVKDDTKVSVDNGTIETTSSDTDVIADNGSGISNISNLSTEDMIGANSSTKVDNGGVDVSTSGSGWCIPGSKTMVNGKEYTIVGLTTYEGKDNICTAKEVTKDGSSTVYYNEGYVNGGNNKFFKMESTGKNAKASAIVTVGN